MDLDLVTVVFEALQNVSGRKHDYFERWIKSDFEDDSLHQMYLNFKVKEQHYHDLYMMLCDCNQKTITFEKNYHGYYLKK